MLKTDLSRLLLLLRDKIGRAQYAKLVGGEVVYKNLVVLSTELIMQIDHRTEILKADVSSVSPSSEQIQCSYWKTSAIL